MSQKLLEKYKIPYLSIDHLKMGLYRGVSNIGFSPLDSTEVIGEKLWPILKGIIMTNIENDQSLIIEGCYILPHHIKDFEESYSDHIISVFLGFSRRYITDNFASNIIANRSAIETRKYDEDRTVEEMILEHDEMRRKCLEHRSDYFEINEDYISEITQVYEFIEMKKQLYIEKTRKLKNNNNEPNL
ncbi:2-phosphoglycerate kinase [Paenibacillus sp. D2_2]|uniref:2-phosphoglycerate kinase n=1 Tax=Paenibacillus sp. D2_2 TaxID=3073092 RepID=UPI0028163107|nr:2-phosphoglycerate kinase [Paenibacillus sp. D2_2]WMT39667.1 2-phosphoglycerate kinase [Paenibacillus sp. D2_2]